MADVLASEACKKVISAVLEQKAWKATYYINPAFVVRASRKLYKYNNRQIRNTGTIAIVVTLGSPNALDRDFIKDCKKAAEPFPVKKIQLRFPPKKK